MTYTFTPESDDNIKHVTIVVYVIKYLHSNRYYAGIDRDWQNGVERAKTYPEHPLALQAITEEINIDGDFTIETIYQKKINYTDY
jgi:hypothetical protein